MPRPIIPSHAIILCARRSPPAARRPPFASEGTGRTRTRRRLRLAWWPRRARRASPCPSARPILQLLRMLRAGRPLHHVHVPQRLLHLRPRRIAVRPRPLRSPRVRRRRRRRRPLHVLARCFRLGDGCPRGYSSSGAPHGPERRDISTLTWHVCHRR